MKKILLSLVVIGMFVLTFVSAHPGNENYSDFEGCGMFFNGYGMMSGMYGFGGIAFSWIFSILILVLLILAIIWFVKQLQKK